MGYKYTPTYYSGLQDTIASLCKSILPSFRVGRRLTADQAAARRHAEQLKWQQESFHRILHLAALHREGIVPASDVAAFRGPMLAALAAPPQHPEQPAVLRDKLLFLQELLYAKCISAAEYNASKAPLVQRLAALGVVVDCPDAEVSAEEWSEIDLRDPPPPAPAAASDKPKHKAFITPWKSRSNKEQDANSASRPPLAPVDQNNAKNASVLMAESSPSEAAPSGKAEKGKRRHLAAMFNSGGNGCENKDPAGEEGIDDKETAKGKKKSSWGFDGLKKWKKAGCSNGEAAATGEQPERALPRPSYSECRLEASPMAASGPDAKRAKTKLHSATGDESASELLHDKVLVENTKKELSRIQAELSSTNRNLNFSDQQIEAISTKLPVDKSDLKPFFPKAWCDQHGDGVITAAKKEFKEHVEEMEKQRDITGNEGWATFEDIDLDDNFNPRSFSQHQPDSAVKGNKDNESLTSSFTNPFYNKNPFLNTNYN
ncbi:uncharacterized protein LOC120686741 isoform X1 [Panicum virgatum]|uniref:Uncharacterized protein n=1 Tax=Panicum virgatum TaxID=38727 RepID=A0A8T0WH69_PANVG|nr:uncharacterized protein LOC120686741 isoform X1 [Panicum virgatum]KAG2645166.1 hypothetical protein PVAP13_2KG416100 [Panicum virgatum]